MTDYTVDLLNLVPPEMPKVRALDYESWNAIAHAPFDGKFEDNFTATRRQDLQLPCEPR